MFLLRQLIVEAVTCVICRMRRIKVTLTAIVSTKAAFSERTLGRARLLPARPATCNSNHSPPHCGFMCLFWQAY